MAAATYARAIPRPILGNGFENALVDSSIASGANAQGGLRGARDLWISLAVKSLDGHWTASSRRALHGNRKSHCP